MTEKVFPKEYFELQFKFAQRAAELSGVGMYRALCDFTSFRRMLNIPYGTGDNSEVMEHVQRLTAAGDFAGLVAGVYAVYLDRADKPFSEEKGIASGCFKILIPDKNGLSRIHFLPDKVDEPHPLSAGSSPNRLNELKTICRQMKQDYSDRVKQFGGFSWLYGIPAYGRLFPTEYIASAVAKPDWFGSLAMWGQFLNRDLTLRWPDVKEFEKRISTVIALKQLKAGFKHYPIETRAPAEAFYDFYQV